MAIGNTTQYGADVGLQTAFEPGFVDAVYRLDDFLSLHVNKQPVFPMSPMLGDISSERWKVNSAGNTSVEIFTESGSAPTPVAQTYVNAAVAATYFRGTIRITGHVRDAIRLGAAPSGLNVFNEEFGLGALDLKKLVKDSFIGSSNSGLEVAIDASTTYAGIARGSATYWESQETAVGGAQTLAAHLNMIEALGDNDVGANTGLILGPRNQLTNYSQLPGAPGAANTTQSVDMAIKGGANGFDLAPRLDAMTVAGIPFVGVGGMTDTVLCYMDITPGNWHLKIRRGLELRPLPHSGDDDVWQISSASALICKRPKLQGKNTGVTA